jgi:hypothetical protein
MVGVEGMTQAEHIGHQPESHERRALHRVMQIQTPTQEV